MKFYKIFLPIFFFDVKENNNKTQVEGGKLSAKWSFPILSACIPRKEILKLQGKC